MSNPVLSRLVLQRFRSLRSKQVEFDNPTFLVGQNGSGKSNFADAFALLGEAMISPAGGPVSIAVDSPRSPIEVPRGDAHRTWVWQWS